MLESGGPRALVVDIPLAVSCLFDTIKRFRKTLIVWSEYKWSILIPVEITLCFNNLYLFQPRDRLTLPQ